MPGLRTYVLAALFSLTSVSFVQSRETLDLSGSWRVALDPRNLGAVERWHARPVADASLTLPGSLQQARLGDAITLNTRWTGGIFDKSYFTAPQYAPYREPGNIKVPFWLQPETHYTGAAWYQRAIEVPAGWAGRRIVLSLERPHWKTTVWLDDREIGTADSLSVPHEFDLGDVTPGAHRLTIRVDNTLDPDIGDNSHSVSDHTQGNWNGMVGRLELVATAPAWVGDLRVFPRLSARTLTVRGRVLSRASAPLPAAVGLEIEALGVRASAPLQADGSFDATVKLPEHTATWDEFTPTLYRLDARIPGGEGAFTRFGLREIRTAGRRLLLNGRPLFLRGTLDCAAYPRTGHPPMDLESWKQVLSTVKAHGLNHVRFHSWCPPRAAFDAADELGVYLQIEVASWPNWTTTLGDGKPVDAWLEAETDRIQRTYGNHPSFVLLCAGNEPGGEQYSAWLARWVTRQKSADPSRLYVAGAGWPELPENDVHVVWEPRIQHWGAGLKSRINARPPETTTDYGDHIRARSIPVVSHEIGQWCVYPNFDEMSKYTGYLKPRNFEIFRASLEANGLGGRARDFLEASGKLQALCYKEDIESSLRTREMGGFQLLGLSDFPGQGTALVGVLDAFWEEKGYITPAEFRRFCRETVPLARLPKRVYTTDEFLTAEVEVAHFGPAAIPKARAAWKLQTDDGQTVAGGDFPVTTLELGARNRLGRIDQPLAGVAGPRRYRLVVGVAADGEARPRFENDWDVWVYPPAEAVEVAMPPGVTVTSNIDPAVQEKLAQGGAVVLMLAPERVAPDPERGPVALGFSSIFWNTGWTNGQAPHTLGLCCDPAHPALAAFPTDPWSNWQWWYPIAHAAPMLLSQVPRELQPIVQVIDDWFTNRKLALVFECRVGRGRLLVTSVNLHDPTLDPVRRQLRASLLAYAASTRFQPATEVTFEQLQTLVRK